MIPRAAPLAFAALWLLLVAPLARADLGALIDSVIETYGGAPAVARTRAFRVEAEVTARLRGGAGQARRDVEAPHRLRVTIAYPSGTEVRILDGDRGWRGDDHRLDRVTGLPKLAMEYQLLRSALPWALSHYRSLLEDRGTVPFGNGQVRLVALRPAPGLELLYGIDTANRRVLRVEGVLRHNGMAAPFATDYGDFRRIEGVLIPFLEENYASGQHTGTTRVSAVHFAPPDLGPFAPTGAGSR